jgi:hypothetical protein
MWCDPCIGAAVAALASKVPIFLRDVDSNNDVIADHVYDYLRGKCGGDLWTDSPGSRDGNLGGVNPGPLWKELTPWHVTYGVYENRLAVVFACEGPRAIR